MSREALNEFRKFVDLIEVRAMACDGPVTPFLDELNAASTAEKERFVSILRDLYALSAPAPSIDAETVEPKFGRLFPTKTAEEVDRDPAYRQVQREMKPLRDMILRDTAPDTAARMEAERYQDRVAKAHTALFHDDPTDVPERLARFFEEANEACQSLGMTREDAHKLVDYTYDRPTGEPALEIGAAALTLASLCVVAGYDMEQCAEADLAKLQRPETIARIRAKRATRHGRGPLPGLSPARAALSDGGRDG